MVLGYERERKRKQSHKLDGSVAAAAILPAGRLARGASIPLGFLPPPPSHPSLGGALILGKEAPAFASSITKKKGRLKIPLRKTPLLFWKLEKRSKNLVFCPFGRESSCRRGLG